MKYNISISLLTAMCSSFFCISCPVNVDLDGTCPTKTLQVTTKIVKTHVK